MSFYIQMIKCPLGPWPCAEGFIQFNSKSLSVPSLHKRKVTELLGIKLTDLSIQCNNQSQHYSVTLCTFWIQTFATASKINPHCYSAVAFHKQPFFGLYTKAVTFQFNYASYSISNAIQLPSQAKLNCIHFKVITKMMGQIGRAHV